MESWVQEYGAETSSQAGALAGGFLLSQAEEQKEQVELQCCTVKIRDPEGKKNPSNPPQELFFRRISWEDQTLDTSGEKQRMKFSGFHESDQSHAEPLNQESLVSFEEVAVYFSEEEWSQLDSDQKALHSEVMLENYRNVVSLGRSSQQPQDTSCLSHRGSWSSSSDRPAVSDRIWTLLWPPTISAKPSGRLFLREASSNPPERFFSISTDCSWTGRRGRWEKLPPLETTVLFFGREELYKKLETI